MDQTKKITWPTPKHAMRCGSINKTQTCVMKYTKRGKREERGKKKKRFISQQKNRQLTCSFAVTEFAVFQFVIV